MSNLKKKEKNLNNLIDKLGSLNTSYSQSSYDKEKLITEKNKINNEKILIEKKHEELIREHEYLKKKILKLQNEINQRLELEEKFGHEIEELNQETENLVKEIDEWQT
tara:strand:- start:817 stop:1140 length:324 start_codon:yes stop_codon:yes gene_type:complete